MNNPIKINVCIVLCCLIQSGFTQTWERLYGGNTNDGISSVITVTNAGGTTYLAAGATSAPAPNGTTPSRAWLFITDQSGQMIWGKTYMEDKPSGFSDVVASGDDFVLCGGYGGNTTLTKVDALGNIIWNKEYDITAGAFYVISDGEGGYILSGTRSVTDPDGSTPFAMRTDSAGGLLWVKNFSDPWINQYDQGEEVLATSDGHFVLCGARDSFDNRGVLIAKFTLSGEILWEKIYEFSYSDLGWGICELPNGNLVITGETQSAIGQQVMLFQANASGDSLLLRNFGGFGGEWGADILHLPQGGYAICGYTGSFSDIDADLLLLVLSEDFEEKCTLYAGPALQGYTDIGFSLVATADGGIIVGGVAQITPSNRDAYMVRFDSPCFALDAEDIVSEEPAFALEVRYERTSLEPILKIQDGKAPVRGILSDLTGRVLHTFVLHEPDGEYVIPSLNVAAGWYFVRVLDASGKVQTVKVFLNK